MSRVTQFAELPWTIDQSMDLNRFSMEEIKMIFSQAEKRLDDTIRQGESIASKTLSMITLMAGLLIALCSYLISAWKTPPALADKDLVAIFGCVYILGLLIYVINNIMTYHYSIAGSMPEQLMNFTYPEDDIRRTKMLLLLYINEIENYNGRIAHNTSLNHRRWRRYRISVNFLLCFPLLLALLFEVLEWFRRGK